MNPLPRDITVAGHFGEWIQGRMGPDGPLVLVTLRCDALFVRACTTPPGDVVPFDADDLSAFFETLGLRGAPLPLLERTMPLGCGAGGSTATLVALARAMGFAGSPGALARACLGIEGATDPLMFEAPDTLLWASREARTVRRFRTPPHAQIVGGYWGETVLTDPADCNFPDISDLITPWQAACDAGNLSGVATLATQSAARSTDLRGPGDPMAELARDTGALGVVRAHTGSARGLVFGPDTNAAHAEHALAEAGLTGVFSFGTGGA